MADQNDRLAALMDEGRFSHKSLARAVVAAAACRGDDLTCDHTYVSRWLRGSIPRGDLPHLIAEVIGQKVGHRLTVDDIGMGHAAVRTMGPELGLDFSDLPEDSTASVVDLWRADLAEADVLVRANPESAAWHEASVRWLVAPPDGAIERVGRKAVRLPDVEMIRNTADAFSTLDGKYGGGHARRALIQYLHSDVRPILEGTYSDAVGRQLYSATAEALLLAGWMSYDSGLHGVAQRYLIQALRMTHAAGDRRLGGSVLSAMSHQATFVGRYREAATLARAAIAGPTGGLTPTLAAQFRAMEARALARLGDARGCDQALADAERQLARRTADSDPAYIAYFDEIELAAEMGHCFRDLGRYAQAAQVGTGSIFGDGVSNRSDFFATTVQAEAYLGQGELQRGLELTLTALELGESLKSARCQQYMRELRSRVTPAMLRTSEFREFADQAADFELWAAVAA